MTVLENMGRVRNAKKLAKQMGVTIRRSVPDEIQPMQDRYETVASLGFDSKSAGLSGGEWKCAYLDDSSSGSILRL